MRGKTACQGRHAAAQRLARLPLRGGAVVNLMANDTGNNGPGPAQVDLPGSFPEWLSPPVSPFRRAGPPPKSDFAVWAGALRSPLALGRFPRRNTWAGARRNGRRT